MGKLGPTHCHPKKNTPLDVANQHRWFVSLISFDESWLCIYKILQVYTHHPEANTMQKLTDQHSEETSEIKTWDILPTAGRLHRQYTTSM